MKKCKSCKSDIDNTASKCSHCGTDQRGWFLRHKVLTGIIAVVVIFGFIGAGSGGSKNSSPSNSGSTVSSSQGQSKAQQNKPTPTTAPAVPTIPFDKKRGNNSVAATQAQKIKDSFDSTMAGFIKDVYVELNPQDLGGKSESDYEKSVLQGAQINIIVDGDSWDNTSDSVKKDFVSGIITAIHGNINVYPSITVNNGIRNVAEGSWDVWNGQVSVTLE